MARRPTPARRRSVALLAALVATILLAGVLAIWLGSDAAAARAPFGSGWAIGLVVAGLVAVVLGGVLVGVAPPMPSAARWTLALVLSVVNGAVGCLALVLVLNPDQQADVGIGLLLGIAVFLTNAVSGQVARRAVAA